MQTLSQAASLVARILSPPAGHRALRLGCARAGLQVSATAAAELQPPAPTPSRPRSSGARSSGSSTSGSGSGRPPAGGRSKGSALTGARPKAVLEAPAKPVVMDDELEAMLGPTSAVIVDDPAPPPSKRQRTGAYGGPYL